MSATKAAEYAARLGRRLRRARIQSGLTVCQLASSAEVHRNTIYRWELGMVVPRVDQLSAIRKALLEKGCEL